MKKVSIRDTNVFALVFLVSYLVLAVVASFIIAIFRLPDWSSYILSEIVLIAPVAVFLAVKKVNPLKMDFIKTPHFKDVVLSVLYAVSLLPVIYLLNIITMTFSDNLVNDAIGEINQYSLPVQLLLMAVLPALVEEFIFRCVFFGAYRKRNILGGVFMSGLIFGLIHLNVNQCVYAVAMGIAFALLVEASGSIFNSVAAHFFINGMSVTLSAVMIKAQGLEEYISQSKETSDMLQAGGITGIPVMLYAVMAAFAIGGCMIAFCILRNIAGRNNRSEHMKSAFKAGFSVDNEETTKYFDIFSVAMIILAVGMMIYVMI